MREVTPQVPVESRFLYNTWNGNCEKALTSRVRFAPIAKQLSLAVHGVARLAVIAKAGFRDDLSFESMPPYEMVPHPGGLLKCYSFVVLVQQLA